MFVRSFISGFIALAATALFSGSAFAQSPVGSMENFYSKSKDTLISVTDANVYKSQTRTAVTGGSYVWRAPQENAQLLTAQLPSINAGCGGIDIFAGSFSFINGDQIESLFRAILQDAAGYAFHLAICQISPQICNSLESLTDTMNRINASNINSCEAGTALVDDVVASYNAKKVVTCSVRGTAVGVFPDALAGSTCGDQDPGEVGDDVFEATGDVPPTNQNYAMKATANSSIKDELDLREFYMSITGTLVTYTGDQTNYTFYEPISLDGGVIRALMTGGEVKGHKCIAVEPYSVEDCFEVERNTNIIDIPASAGFLIRVQDTLGSIYDKAEGGSILALTPQEVAFVEDTPLAVARAAQLFSMVYPENGRDMLLQYSEMIAYNITLNFLKETSRQVLNGAGSNTTADQDSLRSWRDAVQKNIDTLTEEQSQLQLRFDNVQTFMTLLQDTETLANAKVAGSLLRAANQGQ